MLSGSGEEEGTSDAWRVVDVEVDTLGSGVISGLNPMASMPSRDENIWQLCECSVAESLRERRRRLWWYGLSCCWTERLLCRRGIEGLLGLLLQTELWRERFERCGLSSEDEKVCEDDGLIVDVVEVLDLCEQAVVALDRGRGRG